ncbi:MAG: hypothetical protein GY926_04715, partial [bacterium]|nr:hypothetical protein [bacterium]
SGAMLRMIGQEDRWEEYTRRAAELALQARAEFASDWKKMGAQIIGGCCATAPEHIAALPAAVGR